MQKSDNVKNSEVPLRTDLRDPPRRRHLLDVFFFTASCKHCWIFKPHGEPCSKILLCMKLRRDFYPGLWKWHGELDGAIQILFIALIRKGKQFIRSIKHPPFVPWYCVLRLKPLQCQRKNSSKKLLDYSRLAFKPKESFERILSTFSM